MFHKNQAKRCFFQPDFLSHIGGKESQAITVYRPMADEEGENINKIRFGAPDDQKDHVRYLFLFFFIFLFFPQTLNSFTPLDTDQNR